MSLLFAALFVSQLSDPARVNFQSVDWYLPNGSFYTTISADIWEIDGFDIDNTGRIKRGAFTGDCTASAGSSVLSCPGIATNATDIAALSASIGGAPVDAFTPRTSGITLTSGTAGTVASITLTPGKYEISAQCGMGGVLTAGLSFTCGLSTTTTMPTQAAEGGRFRMETPTVSILNADVTLGVGPQRITVVSTTTWRALASSVFTLGTATAYGSIHAIPMP